MKLFANFFDLGKIETIQFKKSDEIQDRRDILGEAREKFSSKKTGACDSTKSLDPFCGS